jgi:FkbM family methyltransferase
VILLAGPSLSGDRIAGGAFVKGLYGRPVPILIEVPRNASVVRKFGPYRRSIDIDDGRATAVQRHLRRGGLAGWEPQTQATLLSLVQSGSAPVTFLDVGAHVGIHSLLVNTVFPSTHVSTLGFEPTPTTAALQRELFRRNGRETHLEELALSDAPGTATLYLSDRAETSNSLAEGFRRSSASVEVEVSTLDNYCAAHDIVPDVIKIDVETLEAAVLLGASHLLQTARPSVVCELLPAGSDAKTADILAKLEQWGYHLHFWSADEARWTESSPAEITDRRGQDGVRDFLFTPNPLSTSFHQDVAEWLAAISTCDKPTNRKVDDEKRLAAALARLHPAR